MESPEKKPSAGPVFGTSSGTPSFSFGQPPPNSNSSFSFGQSSNTLKSSNNPFGTTSIAGTSSTETTKSPAPEFSFGQTSSAETTESPTSAPLFPFGKADSADTTKAPAATPAFSFGKPDSTDTTKSPAPPPIFSFGRTTNAEPAEIQAPTFSFGKTNTVDNTKSSAPTFTFGQSSNTSESTGNLFGDSSKSDTTSAERSNSPTPAFSFGQPQTIKTSNVLFGQTTNTPVSSAPLFGTPSKPETTSAEISSVDTARPMNPSFSFGQSSSTGNLFKDLSKDTTGVEGTVTPKPFFSFGMPQPHKASNFPLAQSSSASGNADEPSRNIFEPKTSSLEAITSSTPGPAFGLPEKNLGNAASLEQKRTPAVSQAPQPSTNLPKPKEDQGLEKPAEPLPQVKARSNAPPAVNPAFSQSEALENSKSYRLRSLDREFIRRVSALDFHRHDLAPLVRYYIEVRESIGESMGGLYARATAGMKRKADDPRGQHEDSEENAKRSRPTTSSKFAENTRPSRPAASSIASAPNPADTAQNNLTTSTTTSSLFQKMLSTPKGEPSKAAAIPASAPAKNVFADLQPVSALNSHPGFKPSSSLGSAAIEKSSFSSAQKPEDPVDAGKTASTTPTKSPPKQPVFEMPKFNANPPANSFAAFSALAATSTAKMRKENSLKRKEQEFDSDEETEAEYEARAKRARADEKRKIESVPLTGFKPVFDSQRQSSLSQESFSADATKMSGSESAPIASIEPVEITDDEEEDGEKENEDPNDGNYEDDGEQDESDDVSEEDSAEEEEGAGSTPDTQDDTDDVDLQTAMNEAQKRAAERNKGKSLFDRIEKPATPESQNQPSDAEAHPGSSSGAGETRAGTQTPILQQAPNNSFKPFVFGTNTFQSTPKAPTPSPFTPANGLEIPKEPFQLAKTFNFAPATTVQGQAPGDSVLQGAPPRAGPIPGEGLFGSRSSTPVPEEQPSKPAANVFANLGKTSSSGPKYDNTWKPGTPIKFGSTANSENGPTVNVTAATPPAKEDELNKAPFASLFGSTSTSTSKPPTSSGNVGFGFSPAPGFLSASSYLGASADNSAATSRASTPGTTDNESTATNEVEEIPNDPQTSLMESRVGEEDDEVLFESRAKACKFVSAADAQGTKLDADQYNGMGLGVVRILRNKSTGKTRILLRADPSSRIVVNSYLQSTLNYTAEGTKSGAVRFAVPTKDKIERWMLKFKTRDEADRLVPILNANKA